MAGRIIALANQKGGVGKTTTAINLAACLAEAGERALLVDLDPQANATSGLGEKANGVSSFDLLDGAADRRDRPPDALSRTWSSSLPSPTSPARRWSSRGTPTGSATCRARSRARARRYGYVFLDCPPSFGTLTVNALAAADSVIVPVQAEYYALEGLSQLLGSIELVKARLNPKLGLAGILLTMVDGRTRLAAEVEAEVRRHFGDLVFTTTVPRSVRLAEAPSHGLPAIAYDRRSSGAEAYWKVAMELVERAASARRGLGRGLEVLIGGAETGPTQLAELPVDAIHANPRQPRRRFEPEATRASRARSSSRACCSRSSSGRGKRAATS